jgi:spoIIIJ-associated protein
MIKVYSYEGTNEEECRMKCYDELDVYDNEIITKEYEEDNLYKIDVVKKSEVESFIEEFLTDITNKMNIQTRISIMEDDDIYNVKLNSKKNAILIGKDGRTLNALQVILRQVIRNMCKMNIKVNLDVSNYKSRQDKNFEYEIKQIINEVMKTKVDTTLDPMNSYKRRIVHTIASNYYNIETESIGEEPNRQTIIKYVEK